MGFSGDFWTAVAWAAGIATALATGISTIVTFWWRRLDQRRADFMHFSGESFWHAKDGHFSGGPPTEQAKIANVGDGTAYRLTAFGIGCHALFEGTEVHFARGSGISWRDTFPVVPKAEPGWTAQLTVVCPPSQWSLAQVVLAWTESPTWRRRKSRRVQWIRVSDIADSPRYLRVEFNSETGAREHVTPETAPDYVLPDSGDPRMIPFPGTEGLSRRTKRKITSRLLS